MWIVSSVLLVLARAEPALAPAVDDTEAWAVERAAALVAIAPAERLEQLRTWVTAETSEDRRASLVAVGRLGPMLSEAEGPSPHLETYAREMLVAVSGGRRSYIAAAAGMGGAVDEEGDPTMSEAAAIALYTERRAGVGGASWTLCWDTARARARGLGTMVVDGEWRAAPLPEEARLSRQDQRLFSGDCLEATGWTVYLGERPIRRAADLPAPMAPTSSCAPTEITISRSAVGSTVGSSRLLAVADPRPDDCITVAQARAGSEVYNAAIREDLKLDTDPTPGARPPGATTLRQCERSKPAFAEVCAALSE